MKKDENIIEVNTPGDLSRAIEGKNVYFILCSDMDDNSFIYNRLLNRFVEYEMKNPGELIKHPKRECQIVGFEPDMDSLAVVAALQNLNIDTLWVYDVTEMKKVLKHH